MIASPGSNLYSYDPQQNAVVRQEELAIPPSLRQALANLPEVEQQRIVEDYRNGMGQARRIDYLFHMGKPPKLKAFYAQGTVWRTDSALSQPGSDHYGVLNTYDLRPLPVLISLSRYCNLLSFEQQERLSQAVLFRFVFMYIAAWRSGISSAGCGARPVHVVRHAMVGGDAHGGKRDGRPSRHHH